ncbi:PREDICTED: probable tRNA (uracil-O(2)-)-methyltransferase [Branchiostoma belcheri]|uniref:tRNA (uracil-O(2)-)-methyltransferase n=1 Tax=Branchiostoma belcheri TaxID=7741 RepID=A0A6P4YME4_BRABE|nr:PREDICTED: probable tRNA (uracil-O(2)-)-methyltransferase [Branchiostoma belcheri]
MSGREFLPEAIVTRVAALPTAAQVQGFWSGVAVWVDKPHVVNRRLTGAKELARIWTNGAVISTLLQNPKALLAEESSEEGRLQKRLEALKMEGRKEAEADDLELIVRDLLPRQLERAKVVREVIVLDHPQTRAWFVPLGVSRPDDPDSGSELSFKSYRFVYSDSEDDSRTGKTIALDILSPPEASASVHSGGNCSTGGADAHSPNDDGICSPTTKWLCSHLLPKIAKWSEETVAKGNRRRVQELVPIDRYNVRYQQLKRRYGRRMIQVGRRMEKSHSYHESSSVLLVWEEERMRLGLEEKQSFVDLGCGNGLLVYILAQEGHPGKGIDVRKRTTWDIYGPDTVLQMSEVVAMFDKETLQKLKCECGGLKTLLKNKNQVFILRGDSVRLRDWSLEEAGAHKSAGSTNRRRGKKKKKTDRDLRVKTSLCWFYLHHPDGCPRLAQNCYYAHGQAELRNKIGK